MNISLSRVGIVLLFLAIITLSVIYILPLVLPFILGWGIALLINPLVNVLQKRTKMPRWGAVSIALFLFVSLFIGLITLIIAEVSIELIHLGEILPTYINQFTQFIKEFFPGEQFRLLYEKVQNWYGNLNTENQGQLEGKVGEWVNVVGEVSLKLVSAFVGALTSIITSLPNMATILIISILASFFISKDYEQIRGLILGWIPNKIKRSSGAVLADLRKAFFGFLRAQLTLMSITAFLVTIGLIILRVEYAITIGLITGLLDLLPYLGTGTIFVPWIIYLFFTEQYSLVIGLSTLYAIIIVVRQIIEPKILAESVGLDPLVTLIALFVGLQLFGFLGLIIGPVSVVILLALHKANVFHDIWNYIKKEPI